MKTYRVTTTTTEQFIQQVRSSTEQLQLLRPDYRVASVGGEARIF